jgi:hypothetical protein
MKQKKSKAKRPAPRKKPPERAAKPPPPTKKPVAVKPKTVRKPEDPRVKKFQSALGHALYNRRMLDRAFAELREKMSETKKKALQALAAAALAVSAAAQVLAEDEETSTPTPAEPAKPETPKAPPARRSRGGPQAGGDPGRGTGQGREPQAGGGRRQGDHGQDPRRLQGVRERLRT